MSWTHRVELGRTLPDGRYIRVTAGLQWLYGNTRPYFSLTGEEWKSEKHWRNDWHRAGLFSCGQIGEAIREAFPELAPLQAIHLSDDEGAPMHALANARFHAEQGDTETAARLLRLDPEQLPRHPSPLTWEARNDTRRKLESLRAAAAETPAPTSPATHEALELWDFAERGWAADLERLVEAQRPRWRREADEARALLIRLGAKEER